MREVILDSWAILAMLNDEEPAAATVDELFSSTRLVIMSYINLGEVLYIVQRNTDPDTAETIVRDIREALNDVLLPSRQTVMDAAGLKARYRMSYADAFAAATAISANCELWTGDPELLIPDAPWAWRDLRSKDVVSWSPVR